MILLKPYEFYIKPIDYKLLNEATNILNEKEKALFNSMCKYDKLHSLNVYEGVKELNLDSIYLKLALLHDVGKLKAGFFVRVLHKLGFKTKLFNHAKRGYDMTKDINLDLAKLILVHHDKDVDENMKKFQGVDNAN